MNPILVYTLLMVSHALTNVQSSSNLQNFTVYYKAQKVGTLTTTKTIDDKKSTYNLSSDVKITMVAEFHIVEAMCDVFDGARLQTSSYSRSVNNEQKVKNTVVRNANEYVLSKDGKRAKVIKEWILTTVMSLYYQEPTDLVSVYSQSFQEVLKLTKLREHVYSLKLPHGKSTIYQYTDGKIYSVTSDTNWGKVKFVRDK